MTRDQFQSLSNWSRAPPPAAATATVHRIDAPDLGDECRLCGEHGFAIVTADGIKWNDDD
jgi:hypothetical protein